MVALNRPGAGAATAIESARTIIVKIGSSLLVEDSQNLVDAGWLAGVASDIAMLRKAGKNIVVVSSGAIALGRRELGIEGRELALEEKQAAAATGQVTLAHAWREALATHGIGVAQILLSPEDTETRRRHLNARATMGALLELGAVPVVNENDTVATAEIRFGDNDRLAARVAAMISADLLVLLSDIDGLYTANPRQNPDASHVPQVDSLNDEVMAMAGQANATYASGGMITTACGGVASGCLRCCHLWLLLVRRHWSSITRLSAWTTSSRPRYPSKASISRLLWPRMMRVSAAE